MKKTKVEKKYGYLVVNGKYYEIESERGVPKTKLISKTVINDRLKKAKQIAKKLKTSLDAEKVLTESLMINFNEKDLNNLHSQLFHSKRKYIAKTREHHCVDMIVGNTVIPIVD